jgi:hypothetical protein
MDDFSKTVRGTVRDGILGWLASIVLAVLLAALTAVYRIAVSGWGPLVWVLALFAFACGLAIVRMLRLYEPRRLRELSKFVKRSTKNVAVLRGALVGLALLLVGAGVVLNDFLRETSDNSGRISSLGEQLEDERVMRSAAERERDHWREQAQLLSAESQSAHQVLSIVPSPVVVSPAVVQAAADPPYIGWGSSSSLERDPSTHRLTMKFALKNFSASRNAKARIRVIVLANSTPSSAALDRELRFGPQQEFTTTLQQELTAANDEAFWNGTVTVIVAVQIAPIDQSESVTPYELRARLDPVAKNLDILQ